LAKYCESSLNACLQHNGANIQLLDLPGIIEGAAQGKTFLGNQIFNFDLLIFALNDIGNYLGCYYCFTL